MVRTPARGTSVQLRHSANDRITIPLVQDQEWNLRRGITGKNHGAAGGDACDEQTPARIRRTIRGMT